MECGDRLTETDSSREKGGKTGAQAVCRMESGGRKLHIEATGDWSIANLDSVDRQLRALALDPGEIRSVVIDLEGITRFDTAGAFKRSGVEVGYENVSENQNRLFDKIDACGLPEPAHPPHVPLSVQFASKIGEAVRSIAEEVVGMAGFIGAVVKVAGRTIAHPRRFRMVPFVYHMEKAGFDALPLSRSRAPRSFAPSARKFSPSISLPSSSCAKSVCFSPPSSWRAAPAAPSRRKSGR